MPRTPATRRASAARRPVTQPTSAYRSQSLSSTSRVRGGTAAAKGSATMGASVPSRSDRTAERPGSARSGSSSDSIPSPPKLICPLVSPPMPRRRALQLGAIGTAAGAFSGLLGVGGGTVIVPLLILWLGYEEREATGTSLAAIFIIAALAATGQGIEGNVDVLKGVLIGVPAVGGAIAGTALQQRIPQHAVS